MVHALTKICYKSSSVHFSTKIDNYRGKDNEPIASIDWLFGLQKEVPD